MAHARAQAPEGIGGYGGRGPECRARARVASVIVQRTAAGEEGDWPAP